MAQFLLIAVLSVGIVNIPAVAQAPIQKHIRLALAPKAYALTKVANRAEFACLSALWTRESHWNPKALNKSSGAFGIAQFMPSTWANYNFPYKPKDPHIQIDAGLRYILKRYGTPCKAWAFWQRQAQRGSGWY